jgi:hypothetical protein
MVLTVRHRGQLLSTHGDEPIDDVVALVWFDGDEVSGRWGGIIEPAVAARLVRAQMAAGRHRYGLRLADGRCGTVELKASEFEADGEHPLAFIGVGQLVRPIA